MRCGSRTRHAFKAAVSDEHPGYGGPAQDASTPQRAIARDLPRHGHKHTVPVARALEVLAGEDPRRRSNCRWRHSDHADPAAHDCEPAAPISQRQASATREPDDRMRISGPYAGDDSLGAPGHSPPSALLERRRNSSRGTVAKVCLWGAVTASRLASSSFIEAFASLRSSRLLASLRGPSATTAHGRRRQSARFY